MIRALYTAVSGMMVEARKLDLTSENLYRAQLPGFKAFRVLRAAQPATVPNLPTDIQTVFEGQFVDASSGPLRPTGKDLDLALEGDGFFVLKTRGGVAYTRDGRFVRGKEGTVQDSNGNVLQGEEGPLKFPDEAPFDAAVDVETDGTFRVNGEVVDRIRLRDFPGFRGLQAASGSLFYTTGAAKPQPSSAKVLQRNIEGANVQGVGEMANMMQTIRAFEAYQKVVQTVMDDVTSEAVRRLGRLA